MTEGPDWQPTFDHVAQIPGTETSQKRLTEKDVADKWGFLNRRNTANVAVAMGAVDTGDDFDPWSALADIAEDNAAAVDALDDRVTSLEGAEADVAAITHAADGKTTPVDADELPLVDSEASDGLKKLSWSNLKAAIGTWYDSATRTMSGKTLTDPKIAAIKDANGANILALPAVASAVNYLTLYNNATGGYPSLYLTGSDANIGLMIAPKGSGRVDIYAATGQTPTLRGGGADANHNLNLTTKGTGVVQANSNPVGVKVAVPANASATGAPGQWAADSSYIYVCTAANTWVRSVAATW